MKISEEISNISARISGIWSPLATSITHYARTIPNAFTGVWGVASNLMWWRNKKAISAQESMEEAQAKTEQNATPEAQPEQISVMIEEENEVGGKALSTPSTSVTS